MTFDFDTPINRADGDSMKWDKYKGRDILPMWVADTEFASPPEVMEALHKRIDHGVFGYNSVPSTLVEAVCERMARLYGWTIQPEWLEWVPGLGPGLSLAIRATSAVGESIVTPTPVYHPFLSIPAHAERKVIRVPFRLQSGRWNLDFDEFESLIETDTRLMMLCHPHNPVGRVFDKPELQRMADIALRKNLVICSDEIHCDLILDEDKVHFPMASLSPEIEQETITLMAPSKTWNLAGLRCAFAIIPNPKLRKKFNHARADMVPLPPITAMVAADAVYRHGEEWRVAQVEYLSGNRDRVQQAIADMPGLSTTHIEATYLCWIDTRESGIENPVQFFEQAGVGLTDGADFGAPGFVRLNFGCSRSLLDEALKRMRAALG